MGSSTAFTGAAFLFTQFSEIPWAPTLPHDMRTFNLEVDGGPDDWTSTSPWRSPGSAFVYGSGCGVSAGAPLYVINGGVPTIRNGVGQGAMVDALDMEPIAGFTPAVWNRGVVQQIAFAIKANHGGGYSWRLCKKDKAGRVTEHCFQQNVLKFAGDKQWLLWPNGTRLEVPLKTTTAGTFPEGSQWARIPVPSCNLCKVKGPNSVCKKKPPFNSSEASSFRLMGKDFNLTTVEHEYGNFSFFGGRDWEEFHKCTQPCFGGYLMTEQGCPLSDEGMPMVHYAEPYPGISGFTSVDNWPGGYWDHSLDPGQPNLFSVVDKVQVPEDLELGSYMLSWRWDCESSTQIWQSCTDIEIVDNATEPEDILRLDQPLGMQSPGEFYRPKAEAALVNEEIRPCDGDDGDDCSTEDAALLALRRTVIAQQGAALLPTKDGKGNLFSCQHLRCMCAAPCVNEFIPYSHLCDGLCGDVLDCRFPGCACSEKCNNGTSCSPSCLRKDAGEYLERLPFGKGVLNSDLTGV